MAIIGIKGEKNRIRLEEHIPLQTPLRVLLEASSICNFHCSFCPHGNGEALKLMPQTQMPLDLAKKCIDDLSDFTDKIKSLAFVSFGEPLVNQNLPEIIRYAYDHQVAEKLEITTNASLLTKELSENLIESGLSLINISIYGLNQQSYQEFSKVKINFDALVENIRYLYSIKNTYVVIKISDAVCSTDADINTFYDMFSSICDKICIEHAVPLWYEMNDDYKEKEDTDIYGKKAVHKEVCPVPFFTLSVNANGNVSPCCNDWQNKLIMGNVSEQSLLSIWNGGVYQKLRKALLSGGTKSVSPCCKCRYHELVALDNIDAFRAMLLQRLENGS